MIRVFHIVLALLLIATLSTGCDDGDTFAKPGADALADAAGDDIVVEEPDVYTLGPDVQAVPYGGWDPVEYAGVIWGYSYEGRAIVAERFGDEGPVVYLFFTIHGNEDTAEQLGERTRSWLIAHPEFTDDVQVVYMTLANPDGYLAGTRYNTNFEFSNIGVDLNRNFPAANFDNTDKPKYGPAGGSESETQAIVAIVEDAAPSVIITTHSPLEVVNYDGPAADYAEAASEASGYPVMVDLGPYPGSFGSYAGVEMQIPTITLELESEIGSRAGHEPGIAVMETVLTMAAEREQPSADLSEVITIAERGDGYMAWKLGDSAGQRPLLVERFGDGDSKIAVVAGLDGGDEGVLVAERLRARLLALVPIPEIGSGAPFDVLEESVFLITVANPDGVAAGRRLNNDGLAPDECFPAPNWSPGPTSGDNPLAAAESAVLVDFMEPIDLSAAVVLREGSWAIGRDGDADTLLASLREALDAPYDRSLEARPGSLASWLGSQGVPTITMSVNTNPTGRAVGRAERAAQALLDALRSLP